MPGERRTRDQRRADRERIAVLRLKQKTLAQIAEATGLSAPTISRELVLIRKDWQQNALQAIDEIKAQELAKLDVLEAEAFAEWERSKQDYQKRVVEDRPSVGRGAGRHARVETGAQTGDPRYLSVLLGIQDRRAKLIGADAPQKIAPTNPDGTALSKEHRDAIVRAALANA